MAPESDPPPPRVSVPSFTWSAVEAASVKAALMVVVAVPVLTSVVPLPETTRPVVPPPDRIPFELKVAVTPLEMVITEPDVSVIVPESQLNVEFTLVGRVKDTLPSIVISPGVESTVLPAPVILPPLIKKAPLKFNEPKPDIVPADITPDEAKLKF